MEILVLVELLHGIVNNWIYIRNADGFMELSAFRYFIK